MYSPKYLIELKARTEKALNAEPPDGLSAFTTAWALWEAMRVRILVMACKREGWTVDQARDVLAGERIDNRRFVELFAAVTGGQGWEDSLPLAAGKIWPRVLAAAGLRKRIIDGSTRIGEQSLQRYSWTVIRFVNRLRDHPLGDPLKELPKTPVTRKSERSLKARITRASTKTRTKTK